MHGVWDWDSVEKTDLALVKSYSPNDNVTIRWVRFHSPGLGVSLTDSGAGVMV